VLVPHSLSSVFKEKLKFNSCLPSCFLVCDLIYDAVNKWNNQCAGITVLKGAGNRNVSISISFTTTCFGPYGPSSSAVYTSIS
jgi:hypothetical protein